MLCSKGDRRALEVLGAVILRGCDFLGEPAGARLARPSVWRRRESERTGERAAESSVPIAFRATVAVCGFSYSIA